MKSIAYLIPYFGKLPETTPMWLISCKKNPSVDWIILTDDKTKYDYPENVKVFYCTYEYVKTRIRNHFDFPIVINKPWKLCEYKPAYGQIFAEELKGYDFWGHCDMDLIWGDIRKFITDDILDKYDKIGFQGHSTLYRNTKEVNSIYLTEIDGLVSYKDAFTTEEGLCFDEDILTEIFKRYGARVYDKTNFAHFGPFQNSFYLSHYPKELDYKNDKQVFLWKDGRVLRYYNYKGEMHTEDEFMYLHFFMRPIKNRIDIYDENETYVVYPDIIKRIDYNDINYDFVKKYGSCGALHFYIRMAYKYRKKLTPKSIAKALTEKIRRKIKN